LAAFRRVLVRAHDDDLAQVRAAVVLELVRGSSLDVVQTGDVVLGLTVDYFVDDVVDFHPVVARQHRTGILMHPLNL
jgi:hypothetical protein